MDSARAAGAGSEAGSSVTSAEVDAGAAEVTGWKGEEDDEGEAEGAKDTDAETAGGLEEIA